MKPNRQLAAIMFTDIAGYTKMMGTDRDKSLSLLNKNKKIHKKWLRKFKGKWLKEMGDGILARFPTSTDAVLCAGSIIRETMNIQDLDLKIGIHQGEITLKDNEVYGDGVNIASRIQGLASPNSILVSETVFNNVKNILGIKGQSMGYHSLKNVENNINLFILSIDDKTIHSTEKSGKRASYIIPLLAAFLLLIAYSIYKFNSASGENVAISGSNSIAVLPFEDMSSTQDQKYLGDGVAEEIINVLTRIEDLKVIGRTSSFSFRDKNADLVKIGKQLGVSHILEGSVRKYADQIRVTAQLINANDGSHIWSKNFDNDLSNIFIIQDSIAGMIAERLELTFKLARNQDPPTQNINAYEQYLKGVEAYQSGMVRIEESLEYLENALEIDPGYLDAAADLSREYWLMVLYNLGDKGLYYKKAREMARRAINIDPTSYKGYEIMGFINFGADANWEECLKNYDIAVENGMPLPNSNYLLIKACFTGNIKPAISNQKSLLDSDPLSIELMTELSRFYLWDKDYTNVLQTGERVLQLDPDNTSIKRHMADAYFFTGRYKNAAEIYKTLYLINPLYTPYGYIGTLRTLDKSDKVQEIFNHTINKLNPAKKGLCYVHLDQLDSAFKYFNIAIGKKDLWINFIKLDPHMDLVSEDPRYEKLVQRIDFPEID